jgi:hypothetical protein
LLGGHRNRQGDARHHDGQLSQSLCGTPFGAFIAPNRFRFRTG